MNPFTYNDDKTEVRHENVPDITITHHPYSQVADKPLHHIRASSNDPVEGENTQLEIMFQHLKDVPEQYKRFAKGRIYLHDDNVPDPTYGHWDRFEFPYSKSGKSFTPKQVPSITSNLAKNHFENPISILPIVSSNMIRDYMKEHPEGLSRVHRFFEAHRQLNSPDITTKNTGSRFKITSGPDFLKNILSSALDAGVEDYSAEFKFNDIPNAMRRLDSWVEKVKAENFPEPRKAHLIRTAQFAKDILEHHFPDWRKT